MFDLTTIQLINAAATRCSPRQAIDPARVRAEAARILFASNIIFEYPVAKVLDFNLEKPFVQ